MTEEHKAVFVLTAQCLRLFSSHINHRKSFRDSSCLTPFFPVRAVNCGCRPAVSGSIKGHTFGSRNSHKKQMLRKRSKLPVHLNLWGSTGDQLYGFQVFFLPFHFLHSLFYLFSRNYVFTFRGEVSGRYYTPISHKPLSLETAQLPQADIYCRNNATPISDDSCSYNLFGNMFSLLIIRSTFQEVRQQASITQHRVERNCKKRRTLHFVLCFHFGLWRIQCGKDKAKTVQLWVALIQQCHSDLRRCDLDCWKWSRFIHHRFVSLQLGIQGFFHLNHQVGCPYQFKIRDVSLP